MEPIRHLTYDYREVSFRSDGDGDDHDLGTQYHGAQYYTQEDGSSDEIPLKDAARLNTKALPQTPHQRRTYRRYYFRGLIGLLTPLAVTAFFLAIWQIYLVPLSDDEPEFIAGPRGGSFAFYAWFVVGVLGLNLSKYGLMGVEAGMLLGAGGLNPDASYSDTWSGLGGWGKTLKRLVRKPDPGSVASALEPSRIPSLQWFALAVPSMLVFIALPLSGLSLEPDTGFVRRSGGSDEGPQVQGFSWSNFNERLRDEPISGAQTVWANAMDSRVPGLGVIYTRPGEDPVAPSVLPTDDGLPLVFLTAQGETPIEGTGWGLALQYNCSIVEDMSQLTVLKRRNASDTDKDNPGYKGAPAVFANPFNNDAGNETRIFRANQTGLSAYGNNLYTVAEFGFRKWPNATASTRLMTEVPNSVFTHSTECYYNQAENITGDYPGIDDEKTVFEMVFWQVMLNDGTVDPQPEYNRTIDHNITELYGAYDYNQFQPFNFTNSIPMTAIGARCESSSSVGTAKLDAVHSTFSDFARTDTPIPFQRNRCAPRFGAWSTHSAFVDMMTPNEYDLTGAPLTRWAGKFFSSVSAPPPFYAQGAGGLEVDSNYGRFVQLNYLQASQLRESLLRMHAAYATQLMYTGGQGFTALDGSHLGQNNPNVTDFRAGTVLKAGPVPALVSVVMLMGWALVSVVLTVMYGFRLRWADTVNEGMRSLARYEG